jgi:hypothetical protein
MLAELAELTMQVLRRTAADATADNGPSPGPASRSSPAQMFERLARSLRATIALENRLAGIPDCRPEAKPEPASAPPAPERAAPSYLRKPPADPAVQDDLSLISRRFKGGPTR